GFAMDDCLLSLLMCRGALQPPLASQFRRATAGTPATCAFATFSYARGAPPPLAVARAFALAPAAGARCSALLCTTVCSVHDPELRRHARRRCAPIGDAVGDARAAEPASGHEDAHMPCERAFDRREPCQVAD